VRLVHVTTVPVTLGFFRGQVQYMQRQGVDVSVVSSPGAMLEQMSSDMGAAAYGVPMSRRVSPVADVISLMRLVRTFRLLRPDVVHGHTPKGGLLAMVAATISRVPVRVYHVHGLAFETAVGRRRLLLQATERIACRLADCVFFVSRSVLAVAENEGILQSGRGRVLAAGSINGVDALEQFDPQRHLVQGRSIRDAFRIPVDAVVIGYVGRVVRDKGLVELASAWRTLRIDGSTLNLMIVGPAEEQDAVPAEVMAELAADPHVHLVGWVDDPAPYFAAVDVLVLPSHREGFGLVAIEAAAMKIPVVATRITGIVDAVVDGETGVLVSPRDSVELALAIARYVDEPALRRAHGLAGRERALRLFEQETIWRALLHEYVRLTAAASGRRSVWGFLTRRRMP
jgi:glycosyltransferase involved in cell wall biosynthesis